MTGPAATLLHEVFLADWAFASEKPLEAPPLHTAEPLRHRGQASLQVVASGPDIPGDPLYEGIVAALQEARQSIWIVTPYFIPDEVLWRTLMIKARAGVQVTLIVPARSNHRITDYARRHYLRGLRRAGARVLHFGPGMNHSKVLLVDDRVALLGSANFDLRSLFVNFEIGLFVYSADECRAIKQWIDGLLPQTVEPSIDPSRKPPLWQSVAEDVSRLLAPLL